MLANSTNFKVPVTLSFEAKISPAEGKRLAVHRFNTVTGIWEEMPGSKVIGSTVSGCISCLLMSSVVFYKYLQMLMFFHE